MHERLPRRRDLEQRIALRRHLAERPPTRSTRSASLIARAASGWRRCRGRPHSRDGRRRKASARRNDVATGSVEPLGEALRCAAQRLATSGCRQGSTIGRSAAAEQLLQIRHLRQARVGLDRLEGGASAHVDRLGQHVLRQRDDDRAGPAAGRDVEGARDELREARRIVDLGHPFRDRAEHGAVVDLLECLALAHAARRSARRTGSSASESWLRDMQAGDALVAPGPRVTKQMPGRPVSLPSASAIIAAPPSWRQTVTAIGRRGARRAPRDSSRPARRRRGRRRARAIGRRGSGRRCGSGRS